MKTIAFYNIYEELNVDDFMFTHDNCAIGDNMLAPFKKIAERASILGARVTCVNSGFRLIPDAWVFVDLPAPANTVLCTALASGAPCYLLTLESPLICPGNYQEASLAQFRRVFTWHDDFVNGTTKQKIFYSFALPTRIPRTYAGKKLCTVIAGNKCSSYPNELYSERLAGIRWFERHHPEDFDLYGTGWDCRFPEWPRLSRLLRLSRPSWRGTVDRKLPVLERYRFALCYENIRDVPGYITEKIFDCFFAGCVPVYRGASNITDYIPADCFLDRRQFRSYDKLYERLAEMQEAEYLAILDRIAAFLGSEAGQRFSVGNFASTILDTILNDLGE